MRNTWTYDELTSSHMTLLRLIALIPFKNKTLSHFKTKISSFCCHLSMIIFNIMYTVYGVRMVMRQTIEIDYISEQIVINNIHLRYILLYLKREKLLKLLKTCKQLWSLISPKESNIVRYYERKAYYFRNFMLINVSICLVLFLLPGHWINLSSATQNSTELREPPFKVFWEIKSELEYKMVTIFQDVIVSIISLMICGIETIGNFLVIIPCGFLKTLEQRLLSINKVENNRIFKHYKDKNVLNFTVNDIRMLIHFHQKIMLYCEEVEKFMRDIYFTAVFFTLYNTSILGLKLLEKNSDTMKYGSLFALNLFQFFTCQWGPEYLQTESTAIGKAAYFASFHEFDHRKPINIILRFMIMRSQKPIQMTAGGFVKLSKECFGKMVKSAFSVFALLRNVNN